LKSQFALVVALGLAAIAAVFWPLVWIAVLLLLALFLATTLSFVRWAWRRDRAVALAWPGVTLLRVVVQGLGLAAGLLRQVAK